MMPTIPPFDIFSGRFGEKGVLWLGAVARLDDARARCLILRRNGIRELILSLTQIANSPAAVDKQVR